MALKYQGGKSLIANRIAETMLSWSPPRVGLYFEPFLGGGAVLQAAGPGFHRRGAWLFGSDAHPELMALHEAVLLEGWDPPRIITEERYEALRYRTVLATDAEVAFAGFGCSFGAKWWGGYARSRLNAVTNGYANSVRNGLLKMRKALKPAIEGGDLRLRSGDYRDMLQEARVLAGGEHMVIYCDPPYPGLTKYKGHTRFDMDYFWIVMSDQGRLGMSVFVSVQDHAYPQDGHWKPVAVIPQKRPLGSDLGASAPRREVLLKWMK